MTSDEIIAQISKISHDLRNFLAVIYSNAQLLQLMLEKKKSSEEYETASELIASIEQMQSAFTQKMDELKEFHSKLSDPA